MSRRLIERIKFLFFAGFKWRNNNSICQFSRPIFYNGTFAEMSTTIYKSEKAEFETSEAAQKFNDTQPIWIFGYGSLIWKTNFPFCKKVIGHIKGFTRRFWQGSTDHRGVPGKPGRVVTLIQDEKSVTWGVAYQVLPASVPEVMAYLDHREKGGYTLHEVEFFPKDAANVAFQVFVYIATEKNEEFLGEAPLEEIAKQIATSHGPSGENSEYLLQLARAVRLMGVNDDHLWELEKRVTEELLNNRILSADKKFHSNNDNLYINRKLLTTTKQDSDGED